MLNRRTPIPVSEAVHRVMDQSVAGSKEAVSINESYGRFLAEDIIATNDVPHFNRSPYDGFAVRSIDTLNASQKTPSRFEVIDTIGAGHVTEKQVDEFQTVRIMTGAKLPDECDAVVMLELAKTEEIDGKSYMTIKRPSKTGENVSYRGEDAKAGDILIKKGTWINPGIQALLATFGYSLVPVARKPIIGLFATGTELLEVGDDLQPGKIRNSNAAMISAQIERAGGKVIYFGKLPDEFDICYQAVHDAIDKVDLLITTGGVSVGDFDYLPAIYEKLGAEVLFNKVGMRPGSVTTVATYNGMHLFGLSGNPSACYVGFELFARPVIRKLLFSSRPHLRKEQAVLGRDFTKPNPFTRFVRGKLSVDNGGLVGIPSGVDKSNIVTSLATTDCLIILHGGTRGYQKGDAIEVLLLEDQEGNEWPW
ncbi:gephyrin-like molybdotransferase Glp [Cytobacillus sp. Hz8]|uniref:molybdopterin molybdotransferase MoeA n=1 Tax=Cytobacillus sp. Hz8 TaxID=3347168 RepID=UPI0035E111C3